MDMAKVGGPPIGSEGFGTNLKTPFPLPTTLVFREFCRLLIWLVCLPDLYWERVQHGAPPIDPGGSTF